MSKQALFNYGQEIVMAFLPPVVGSLVKKSLQKGRSREPLDPPPSYALARSLWRLQIIKFVGLISQCQGLILWVSYGW